MRKIKIITIVGARPQILKAAAFSRAISEVYSQNFNEIIVHTGQHYDNNMSQVFFSSLNIPKPRYNLNVGSGSHAYQTAKIIEGVENIILCEKPDYMLVYGDTNSTLAASIAAAKLNLPIIHIEAGLRSFNKTMPEEINRILCDHVSSLLFCPTTTAYNNLLNEGFKNKKNRYNINRPGIFMVGDLMFDNSKYFAKISKNKSKIIDHLNLKDKFFGLVTIHRDHNTDNISNLESILTALIEVISRNNMELIFPIHPRTKKSFQKIDTGLKNKIENEKRIKIIEPVDFFDIIELEKNCKIVFTDSGGLQKESYFFGKPCIVFREETEWVEIIKAGAGALVGASTTKILEKTDYLLKKNIAYPQIFGDGNTAIKICEHIIINSKC